MMNTLNLSFMFNLTISSGYPSKWNEIDNAEKAYHINESEGYFINLFTDGPERIILPLSLNLDKGEWTIDISIVLYQVRISLDVEVMG